MKECLNCNTVHSSDNWDCPLCGYQPPQEGGISFLSPHLASTGGGFKAEYFPRLYKYEAKSFWFKARNQIILWAFRNELRLSKSFCEIGCGTAFVLSAIAKAYPALSITGTEVFIDGLLHASIRAPTAELIQMDARNIPFIAHFECIGAFDVLEHIQEDEIVLAQVFRALKSNGTMLLSVPQHPWLWSSTDVYACHHRRYTKKELIRKVKAAGFEIQFLSSFVSLLLPLMALQRLSSRNQNYNPDDEFKINAVLNAALYLVMQLEFTLLRLGLRFPAGGSLLLLARKQ